MPVKITEVKRVFIHDGRRLPDPDPNTSPEKALELLSLANPEFNNAVVDSPQAKDGELHYKIKVNIGSKG